MLGGLDQLRNPSTWLDTLSEAQMESVIGQVDYLRSLVGAAVNVPCCNVAMRLTTDCELQFSTNGGSSWTTVAGWDANLDGCIKAHIPPIVPPNPGMTPMDQHACNMSGFISTFIIKKAMEAMVAYVGTSNEQAQFAHDLLSSLAFAFPITYAVTNFAYGFYQDVVAQLLSEVEAAAADPVLWADVTCAIFSGIRAVGYVDATNFASVSANLAALSYSPHWAVVAVADAWNNIGLGNMQALQAVGAVDDVDCSACNTTWCHYFDFTVSNQGWAITPTGGFGNYASGIGWEGVPVPGDSTHVGMNIYLPITPTATVTEMQVFITSNQGATSGQPHVMAVSNDPGVSDVCVCSFTFPANAPGYSWESCALGCVGSNIVLGVNTAAASGGFVIAAGIQVRGTGVNPYGSDNCVVGP